MTVWIDWGMLRQFLHITSLNFSKYNLQQAKESILLLKSKIESDYGLKDVEFILGQQLLESDNRQRQIFLEKLWNDLKFPVSKVITISFNRPPEVWYGIQEYILLFTNFLKYKRILTHAEMKAEFRKLAFQTFDKNIVNYPMLKSLSTNLAYMKKEDFIEKLNLMKSEYKSKDKLYIRNQIKQDLYEKIHNTIENTFVPVYVSTYFNDNPKQLVDFINLFESNLYIVHADLIEVWANLVTEMILNKSEPINKSDYFDCVALLEEYYLSDLNFNDKRIVVMWAKRFNKEIKLELHRSGELSKFL